MAKVPPVMFIVICKVNIHFLFQVEPFKKVQEDCVRPPESLFSLIRVASIKHVVDLLLESHTQENPTRKDGVLGGDGNMVEDIITE